MNQFFDGELVRYHAVTGPVLGGLTQDAYYYVVAPDLQHVQLRSVDTGTLVQITPTATASDAHTLTPAQRFTVVAKGTDPGAGFAYLDIKGRQRLPDPATPYTVIIDAVNTTGDANLLLRGSVRENDVSGMTITGVPVGAPAGKIGGIDVIYSGHGAPGEVHYTFFNTPPGTDGGNLDIGLFALQGTQGQNATYIDSTYDIRALNGDAAAHRWLPGIVSARNIIVAAAEPTAGSGKIINIKAITEINGTGVPGPSDFHHVDVLTNGWIDLAEKTDDLRVGRIMSTANDVTLHSPRMIIDALNDGIGSEADVTGVNITMTAGDNEVTGNAGADKAADGQGGIGRRDNFLEINVDVRYGSGATLGVLTANDVAVADKTKTQGIFITEVVRGTELLSRLGSAGPSHTAFGHEIDDLEVKLVQTKGDVTLATDPGSIVDARAGGIGADDANVIGNTINLFAEGGNIGNPNGSNDLEIDSQAYGDGTIAARATGSIDLSEALPTTAVGTFFARDAEVVLLQALGIAGGDGDISGNIRFTVRESAAQGEDLIC